MSVISASAVIVATRHWGSSRAGAQHRLGSEVFLVVGTEEWLRGGWMAGSRLDRQDECPGLEGAELG